MAIVLETNTEYQEPQTAYGRFLLAEDLKKAGVLYNALVEIQAGRRPSLYAIELSEEEKGLLFIEGYYDQPERLYQQGMDDVNRRVHYTEAAQFYTYYDRLNRIAGYAIDHTR